MISDFSRYHVSVGQVLFWTHCCGAAERQRKRSWLVWLYVYPSFPYSSFVLVSLTIVMMFSALPAHQRQPTLSFISVFHTPFLSLCVHSAPTHWWTFRCSWSLFLVSFLLVSVCLIVSTFLRYEVLCPVFSPRNLCPLFSPLVFPIILYFTPLPFIHPLPPLSSALILRVRHVRFMRFVFPTQEGSCFYRDRKSGCLYRRLGGAPGEGQWQVITAAIGLTVEKLMLG